MAIARKKKATKSGKRRARTPKEPPHKHEIIPGLYPDPYRGRGRPALYDNADELQTEIDKYFKWIQGEKGKRKEKVKTWDSKSQRHRTTLEEIEYWIRMPEPPTRTGLVLFLGFSSNTALVEQEQKGDDFKYVIARARARVEMSYEVDLRNKDASRGSQFALSNMGWKNRTDTQQLDRDGKPIDPVPAAVISVTHLAEHIEKV